MSESGATRRRAVMPAPRLKNETGPGKSGGVNGAPRASIRLILESFIASCFLNFIERIPLELVARAAPLRTLVFPSHTIAKRRTSEFWPA